MERMAPRPGGIPAGKSPLNKNRLVRKAALEPAVAPTPEGPQQSFARLLAVLTVCFAVGVTLPVFGGLDFVQRPPGSGSAKSSEGDGELEGAPSGESNADGSSDVAAMRVAPLTLAEETLRIEDRVVESCAGDSGEVAARCDTPSLDAVLEEPLARLATCDAGGAPSGVLSLGLHLDFARGSVARVAAGQSTTLTNAQADKLMACAEEAFVGASLDDVEHEHARYWVYYILRFVPRGSAADPPAAKAEKVVSASGRATVGWKTAIVRETPSNEAGVAARLAYGTRVNVTGRVGDWYQIERGGKALGWVHRKAIGM